MDIQLNWLEELKQSPIFNMSLSSKELFHSNFIGWLLNTYSKELSKFFNDKLSTQKDNIVKNVKREKLNIDISFELGDSLVLIENKVKSIPYIEQLNKYEKYEIKNFNSNCKNIKYILLTIKEPKIKSYNWIYINYTEITEFLQNMNINNKYHSFLIQDYINFINLLKNNIVDNINLDKFQISNLYNKDYEENIILNNLQDIKMHDFYLKGLFEEFSFKVYEYLKTKIKNLNIIFGKKVEEEKSIFITNGMTRSQGLLDVKYKIKDIIIGIQIQGNQYKQFIEGSNKENIIKISNDFDKKNLWFNFINSNDVKEIYPKIKDKVFNKYNSRDWLFQYKSIKIDGLTNNELMIMIHKDVESLISLENIKH